MNEQQERQERGLVIAATSKLQKTSDGTWFVPSQSTPQYYRVKPDYEHPQCSCPDFAARGVACKHVYAAQIVIKREYTDDGETQTFTETVTVRQTYKQNWRAYDGAQANEKQRFQDLLAELCKGIEEVPQSNGRPRLPLADMIFSSVYKVYSTVSGRRFNTDLREAKDKGFLQRAPHHSSIARYLENPTLTPFLKQLIEISSLPLQTVESDFAVDSSGFTTCRFAQWSRAKYGDNQMMERNEWIKVHLMVGTRTHVVTSVEVTDSRGADCPQFKALVDATARNFAMSAVSADKAYLSSDNLQTVVDHNAMPYIPFKSNTKANEPRHSAIWNRMFHYYSYNQEYFMRRYHRRSNVETAFSMIKGKFGDRLRSKTRTAQVNEALCKVLAHNLCCLIQSMYELGIEPTFWEEAA